jgi:hypothetical protein
MLLTSMGLMWFGTFVVRHATNHHGHVERVTNVLTVVGLVILIRDCAVHCHAERELIWSMPPSFSKYIYLGNRYLSPLCFVVVWVPLSGFSGLGITNEVRESVISPYFGYQRSAPGLQKRVVVGLHRLRTICGMLTLSGHCSRRIALGPKPGQYARTRGLYWAKFPSTAS